MYVYNYFFKKNDTHIMFNVNTSNHLSSTNDLENEKKTTLYLRNNFDNL